MRLLFDAVKLFALCFVLAAAASGCRRPQTVPSLAASSGQKDTLFAETSQAAHLDFTLGHPSLEHLDILQTIGHGCAFLDYDRDGRLDILLIGQGEVKLFHNKGNGTFQDVTSSALPRFANRPALLGCSVADYDGDGYPDILLTGYGCSYLFHNEKNGTFRDVTVGSGLEAQGPEDWTTSAAWADVDGDGRLDVYICRYVRFSAASKPLCTYSDADSKTPVLMACVPSAYPALKGSLYHNEGNGHFRDITRSAGLENAHGNALGCQFCDFNADGKPDLYVANDTKPADLFVNLGEGRFRNIGVESGTAYGADGNSMSGMGVDWGDYDNTGRFHLLVSNFAGQPKTLFHSQGHNTFTDASYPSGLASLTLHDLAFSASFVDYDNDGLLDIILANGHVQSQIEKVDHTASYFQNLRLLHNTGNGQFKDESARGGPAFSTPIVGRGLAIGDYDNDGRPDILVVNDEGKPLLLHNEAGPQNHWITLHCLQTKNGSDAIGARITLTVHDHRTIAEVRASGSYLSANAPEIHFGLGQSRSVDKLQIRWPDGKTSEFEHVAADHRYAAFPLSTKLTELH